MLIDTPLRWTNFSQQDKTWADFSTLEVAASMKCCEAKLPNLKLKTWTMQIFGYFLLEIALQTFIVLKVLLQKYPFFSIVTGFAMALSRKQFRHPYGVTLTSIRNNI